MYNIKPVFISTSTVRHTTASHPAGWQQQQQLHRQQQALLSESLHVESFKPGTTAAAAANSFLVYCVFTRLAELLCTSGAVQMCSLQEVALPAAATAS